MAAYCCFFTASLFMLEKAFTIYGRWFFSAHCLVFKMPLQFQQFLKASLQTTLETRWLNCCSKTEETIPEPTGDITQASILWMFLKVKRVFVEAHRLQLSLILRYKKKEKSEIDMIDFQLFIFGRLLWALGLHRY